jgi:hypothetical protein
MPVAMTSPSRTITVTVAGPGFSCAASFASWRL